MNLTAPTIVGMVVCLSLGLLLGTYRRVTGVWPRQLFLLKSPRFILYLAAVVVVSLGSAAASLQLAWSFGVGWWLVPVMVVTAAAVTLLSRAGNALYARLLGAR